MIINGLRCSECGAAEIIAVWPGCSEQHDLFALTPQRPVKCWCERCWLRLFGPTQDALPRRGSRAKAEA